MIAFIAAEPREFRGLERHLINMRRLSRSVDYMATGTLNGRKVLLVANGPGPKLVKPAIQAALAGDLDVLVSTGYCGALDPALRPSQIFAASEIRHQNLTYAAKGADGPLLSLDRVVISAAEKKALHASGARVVEMEAGAVAEAALERGISLQCIRVVTDTADEDLPLDFNQLRDAEGRFSRGKIVGRACLQPFQLFPELIQLDRRCRDADRALGDFIATCQF